MPSPRATFYLNLLKDPNPNVRQKAAKAIGQIGDKTCLLLLKAALAQEQETAVVEAIQEAIAKLQA
jgi:HEAT repeat protein